MDADSAREILGRISGMAEKLAEELENTKVKEGQYWQWEVPPYPVFRISHRVREGYSEFGITYLNGKTGQYSAKEITIDGILLTDKEAEERLENQALKRGFTKPVTVNSLDGKRQTIGHIDEYGYTYDPEMEALFYGDTLIYLQGDWAEIVEDEWRAKKSNLHTNDVIYTVVSDEYKIKKSNGIFDVGFPKEEAEKIANALNELE